MPGPTMRDAGRNAAAWQVLRVALRLGLTSFGGPIAHIGYFERVYVQRHRWLSSEEFGGLVALSQILPGPASSQVGFLIGFLRAGWPGALAAWLGFTLPSCLLLYGFAMVSEQAHGPLAHAIFHGLKLAAVAVVAQAVWNMARTLCPDRPTIAVALGAAVLGLVFGGARTQLLALVLGALGGILLCRPMSAAQMHVRLRIRRHTAWVSLCLFVLLLIGLPVWASKFPHGYAALGAVFYRVGALVFGGGHVVLPLLRDALVPGGWITDERFLAGYGLAQTVPGPLFAVAAYLGAANTVTALPALGALVAVLFIFLPGLLIAIAGASLWSLLAPSEKTRAALAGINASVVGILAAALYDPLWTGAVHTGPDAAIALAGLLLLVRWKSPPVAIVALCVTLSAVKLAF